MKIIFLFFSGLIMTQHLLAQLEVEATDLDQNKPSISYNSLGQKVTSRYPSSFHVLSPFEKVSEKIHLEEAIETVPKHDNNNLENSQDNFENIAIDQNDIQSDLGFRAPAPLDVNFEGQGNGYPPDPSGAAGPNHYLQTVNSRFQIFDKLGNPLTESVSLNDLWSNWSTPIDPIVMYDRHADRWFIGTHTYNGHINIAVSQTADPTGEWYSYEYDVSSIGYPDFQKFSVWWDGYYMTSSIDLDLTAVVFEREKMLVGDESAQMINLGLPYIAGWMPTFPSDADGPLPPNGTPCYFFHCKWSENKIYTYEMEVDWDTPSNSTTNFTQQIAVDPFNSQFEWIGDATVRQPGTDQTLAAGKFTINYRVQHMRWMDYNTILLSHATNVGDNRVGIRWYELRDNNDGVWEMFQSGTYAPDDDADRWFASLAMDDFGNIGMAYSYCDATNGVYPSLKYTGRLKNDPLGEMTFDEAFAIEGSASQNDGERYGDYSHMSLDPDGRTFWYTGEYLSDSGGLIHTRIFSFDLQSQFNDVGIASYHEELEMKIINEENNLFISLDGIYGDDDVFVQLIGMDGRIIESRTVSPINKNIVTHIDVSDLATNIYFVRIGNRQFQKVKRFFID